MTGAQILAGGGTLSALLLTCGFPRLAGGLMLLANLLTLGLPVVQRLRLRRDRCPT